MARWARPSRSTRFSWSVTMAASRRSPPLVDGAQVTAEVLEQGKAPKVIVFKKKRRKNYRPARGHRQLQTVLRIRDIAVA